MPEPTAAPVPAEREEGKIRAALSTGNLVLKVKETRKLEVKASADIQTGTLTLASSNPSVAAVDSSGKVTALAPGYTTITCSEEGFGTVASCEVYVYQPVTSIFTDKKEIILFEGRTKHWNAFPKPYDAGITQLIYSCDNTGDEKIISWDEEGNITGLSAGKTKLTARSGDKTNNVKAQDVDIIVEPRYPAVITEAVKAEGTDTIDLKITNKCQYSTIAGLWFEAECYGAPQRTALGRVRFSLDQDIALAKGQTTTVRKTVAGFQDAVEISIRIVRVRFDDGTVYDLPYDSENCFIWKGN